MKSLTSKVSAAVIAAAVLFTSGAAFARQGGPADPVGIAPGTESYNGGDMAPDVIRKEMSVSGYQLVKVSGKFKVYLKKGDEQKIVVEAEEALVPEVEHFIANSTLNIYTTDKVKERITLWITLKDPNNFNKYGNVRVIREE